MEQLSFDDLEAWKPVPGFEGLYMVSNAGNVRSLPRLTRSGVRGGCHLKPIFNNGYFMVSLYRNGQRTRRPIHQIVLEAFTEPRKDGQEVLHGPGGPLDNRWPQNLRWGTKAENAADKLRDDTHQRGERHGAHVLTAMQVLEIRARYAAGESQRSLGASFGVSRSAIRHCLVQRSWAWLDVASCTAAGPSS